MHKELRGSVGLKEHTLSCIASPPSVTNPIIPENQQVMKNATNTSEIIRIQADFSVGYIEITEEEMTSSHTLIERCAAFDENEGSLDVRDLQGPREMSQENPSTSYQVYQTDGPIKTDQKNDNRLTPITRSLGETVDRFTGAVKNKEKKADRSQLPQPESSGGTNGTNVHSSNDFLIGGDLANEHELTNEPAREKSMDSLENVVITSEQVAKLGDQGKLCSKDSLVSGPCTGTQADNISNDQSLENHNEQIGSLGKTMQPLLECEASKHSDETQPNVRPNDTYQSIVVCEASIPETKSDMHAESQPLFTKQTSEPADSSKEENKCEPNAVVTSQSDTLYAMIISYSKKDDHEDVEPLPPNKQTRENQNILTQRYTTDNHALYSTAKCDTPASGPSSSTGDDRMAQDIEHQTQQCYQTNSTQPSQTTAAAETSSAQAPITTTSNTDYVEKNDGMHVEYKQPPSKTDQEPFPRTPQATHTHMPDTEQLAQPHNMGYPCNPTEFLVTSRIYSLHGSQKCSSMNNSDHQELASSRIDSQMPNNGKLQAITNILTDDQNGHPQKSGAESKQFNSSTKLKPLDVQIPVLQPPVKAPMVLQESLLRPGKTGPNEIEFITNIATNDINVQRSDVEAGILLNKLLKMRSAKNAMTLNDVNEAMIQGKPVPPILYVTEEAVRGKTDSEEPVEHQVDLDQQESGTVTQKMSWVTGSHYLKQYLCWPCLLFGESVWYIPITLGLGEIVEATKNHQTTVPHMSAFMKFLVHEATLKREQEAKLERDLECTKQNELLLRLLIEIMCSNMKGSAEEHVEILNLACSYKDELLKFVKEKPSNFLVSFVSSKRSLISRAVERLVMAKIMEDIKNISFVSIIFEEITDVVDKSLIAVILRYVTDSGVPKERFVKLIKMGMSRTAADFLKTINSVIQEFQLTEKLVGFTFSGTVISPREIIIFNKTVNRIYPKARFFPYQEHNFKKIIMQSLSHLPECRNFFYTINELAEFLKNDPNAIRTLIATDKVVLEEQNERWDFVNDFIATIKYHYKSIMSFFKHAMKHEFDWDSSTIMQIGYFSRFLSSLNCRVLILVISAILSVINDLCTVMEGNVDIVAWSRLLSEATNTLANMKISGLKKILQENTLIAASEYADMYTFITPELYDQIINTSLLAMNHRFVDLELAFIGPRHIEAAANSDPERLAVFLQRIDVDPENFSELQNEAKSFYENPLADKNLEQSIKHIRDSKMVDSARLLRFLRLCLTIPTKDAYSSNSIPAVLRLRSYTGKNKLPKFFDLLIFMEKDILSSMQQEEQFYDHVIEYCTQGDQ